MGELTIVTICQALSNLTHNRCNLVENSNTCRCIVDAIHSTSSTVVVSTAPDIMLSEVFLIFFVLGIWLSAIGFCLNQYKSLRRLETQVHYCVNRKDPLNIGEIKIVTREQDSIIYKKKRYSTILDTHIAREKLQTMHYVQQYLPKTSMKTIPSTLSNLVINRDDLSNNIPLSTTTTRFDSSNNISLNKQDEVSKYQTLIPYFRTDMKSNKYNDKISSIQRAGSARYITGLTVPHISTSNSLHSSCNERYIYDTSSNQHLCVPSNSIGSNCYSDGNISLEVPQRTPKHSENSSEQLLDPRLISATVRRSLLALHRESQENINMLRKKHKTQSENDVHGALTPSKTKIKTKSKLTDKQQYRPHANTLSILPIRTNSNDYDRRVLECVTMQKDNQSSSHFYSRPTNPGVRRSLKHFPKHLTQSTSESETTHDLPLITNIYITTDDAESSKTIIETTEKTA